MKFINFVYIESAEQRENQIYSAVLACPGTSQKKIIFFSFLKEHLFSIPSIELFALKFIYLQINFLIHIILIV